MKFFKRFLMIALVMMARQVQAGLTQSQCTGTVPSSTGGSTELTWNPSNQFFAGGHCQTQEAMTSSSCVGQWSSNNEYYGCKPVGLSQQQCLDGRQVPSSTGGLTGLTWNSSNQFFAGGHCQTQEAMTSSSCVGQWSADNKYYGCKAASTSTQSSTPTQGRLTQSQCTGTVPSSTGGSTELTWNPSNQFFAGGHCQTQEAMTSSSCEGQWSANNEYYGCKAAPIYGEGNWAQLCGPNKIRNLFIGQCEECPVNTMPSADATKCVPTRQVIADSLDETKPNFAGDCVDLMGQAGKTCKHVTPGEGDFNRSVLTERAQAEILKNGTDPLNACYIACASQDVDKDAYLKILQEAASAPVSGEYSAEARSACMLQYKENGDFSIPENEYVEKCLASGDAERAARLIKILGTVADTIMKPGVIDLAGKYPDPNGPQNPCRYEQRIVCEVWAPNLVHQANTRLLKMIAMSIVYGAATGGWGGVASSLATTIPINTGLGALSYGNERYTYDDVVKQRDQMQSSYANWNKMSSGQQAAFLLNPIEQIRQLVTVASKVVTKITDVGGTPVELFTFDLEDGQTKQRATYSTDSVAEATMAINQSQKNYTLEQRCLYQFYTQEDPALDMSTPTKFYVGAMDRMSFSQAAHLGVKATIVSKPLYYKEQDVLRKSDAPKSMGSACISNLRDDLPDKGISYTLFGMPISTGYTQRCELDVNFARMMNGCEPATAEIAALKKAEKVPGAPGYVAPVQPTTTSTSSTTTTSTTATPTATSDSESVICPVGFERYYNTCVPLCKEGYIRDANGVCVLHACLGKPAQIENSTKTGMTNLVEGNSGCITQEALTGCTGGQVQNFNSAGGYTECVCKAGTSMVTVPNQSNSGTCMPNCVGNQRRTTNGLCEPCQSYEEVSADGTQCLPKTCEPGFERIDNMGPCCKKGEYLNELNLCATCPGNKQSTGRSCVCPDGTKDFGGNLCCAYDEIANNGVCTKCPSNKVKVDNSCQCPTDLPNWVGGRCCLPGQVNVGNTCVTCIPGISTPRSDGLACVCSAPDMYFDLTAKQCQVCPAGRVKAADGVSCKCPDGTTYDDVSKTCKCTVVGQTLDVKTLTCKNICPLNATYVPDKPAAQQCVCLPAVPTTGPSTGSSLKFPHYYDPVNNLCKPCGDTTQVVAADGLSCACPAETEFIDDEIVGQRCQCLSTAPWFNTITGKCSVCPTGSTWGSAQKKCLCSGGQVMNADNTACVCPTGQTLVNGVCACPVAKQTWNGTACVCPATQVLNSAGTECVCPATLPNLAASGICFATCVGQQTFDAATATCKDPVCVAPQVLNTATKTCGLCPGNKVAGADGASCVCAANTTEIPAGSNICCAAGQINVNGVCTACTGGKIPNATGTACVCPAGKSEIGGICCDAGQYNLNGVCTACASPRTVSTDGKLCVCPAGQANINGVCTACVAPRVPSADNLSCVCPTGQFDRSIPGSPLCCPSESQYNNNGVCTTCTGSTSTLNTAPIRNDQCNCRSGYRWDPEYKKCMSSTSGI